MSKSPFDELIEHIDHGINSALDTDGISPTDIEELLQKRAQDMRELAASQDE